MTISHPDDDRLAKIEMLLSHLQHDIDKLNAALISQQSEIGEIRRLVSRVESDIDQLSLPSPNPADDKPPHY